ncbi:MAG: hypothetical protein JXB17_13265, partial [Bacteroidales bacterium]|nr:hypothetical protein [Bacteroidales bacterium]
MNKYLHKYILLIFILINFNIKIGAEVRELKFTRLSVEEGLSQSWVLTIAQDYLGYIWIGTNDGLNKYDGYNFTVYKHNPKIKKSLSNNRILYLFEDKDKNFWVGTNNGLNLYDRNNDNFIRQPHWPSSNISCILQDSNGDLYIGSGMGLYVYKYISDSVLHIFYQSGIENSISSNMINFLLQDKNENIWIGTNNSLDIINKIDYSVICRFNNRTIPNISDNDVRYIIEDHEGRIWVGTSSGGINLIYYDSINYKNSKIFNYQNDESNIYSISKGTILSILESKNHYLWIGIENGGLDIIDLNSFNETDPKFNHYKHNPQDAKSIGNNSIHSILEDIQGNIWIGTYGNGINMCQLGVDYFSYFRNISNNLNNKFVNVIFDDNKYLWIGTEGGVNLYEKKTGILHNFTYDPYNQNSLSSNAVWAIEKDREGNIWIGTWAGGLNNYDYKKNVFYHYKFINNNPNSLSSNNIFSILEDTHGNLWIGTMGGGLNLFNKENNTFTRFIHDENNENSISENWVRMIYENSYGELWLSTTVGLDIYDKESGVFTHFYPDEDDPKSLSDKGAVVIFEDSRKNMWFGTQNGLNLFHRADSSFKCYLEEDGLPNNTINGILEDSHGNLWISTNKGISKFINGTEIPKNPVFKNFDISDGLQGNEFNRRSAYKNKEGFMFFGGINGFNAFHPDSIKDNFFIPTVIITDFYIFNKPVPINKKG